MMFNPLDCPACLLPPDRLTDVNSWHGHLPFAFAVVQVLRPNVFVELGTHKGDSYCGFCQAVYALGLSTSCYAVDTWEGDEQAGYYGESVLDELRAYHDERYGSFSTLLRSTFDDALSYFPDRSIDLLHVDGLHTYDAVKHDFETWLPKMSERGVVLLHDIAERREGFGAWRVWGELQSRYPSFEFRHGHGLGVLAVGGAQLPTALEQLFATDAERLTIARFFSFLGSQVAIGHERHLRLAEAQADRDRASAELARRDDQLRERAEHVRLLEKQLAEVQADRDRASAELARRDDQLRERAEHVRLLEKQLAEAKAGQSQVLGQMLLCERQLSELRRDFEASMAEAGQIRAQLDRANFDLRSLQRTRTVRASRSLVNGAKWLIHAVESLRRGRPIIEGIIDQPKEGGESLDVLEVTGWAHSRAGRVTRVEVLSGEGGRVLGSVCYGLERPDVLRAYPWRGEESCGFSGTVDLSSLTPGGQELIVRVTDDAGRARDFTRTVIVQARSGERGPSNAATDSRIPSLPYQTRGEIEHAVLQGQHLRVEGWVLWPKSSHPRIAQIYLGESYVGQTRVHLSRPDIASMFPDNPDACRSGFRFRVPLCLSQDTAGDPARLVVRFVEGQGKQFQLSTALSYEGAGIVPGAERVYEELDSVFAEFREKFDRDPVILDWNSDLGLADTFPQCVIFSPPIAMDALPYLDHSIDLVVVSPRDFSCYGEACRVAEHVVVAIPWAGRADGSKLTASGTDGRASPVRVNWLSDTDPPLRPSASIIIAVHNGAAYTEACLGALKGTLPRTFRGEVIIVDDASTDDTAAILRAAAAVDNRIRVLTNSENLGFIDSCNRAAIMAASEILVFLNNDTVPLPGWLDPLMSTFRNCPDAGAVGGKLLYPDGRLQEAGCFVFSDGSAVNFGKGDESPDAPLYSYLREVDYCSGALLATPRALFLDLGGFDTRFRPAYYEDADYCFSLRERGYRVYYQPDSKVVHVEGGTAGTDVNRGAKRYQVTNKLAFVGKWGVVLEQYPPPPDGFDFRTWRSLLTRDPRGVLEEKRA